VETLRSGTEWFRVDNVNATGTLRRAAMRLATRLGFSESRAGEAGIVAAEATSNVWRHAVDGVVGVQIALQGDQPGIQIIAVDHGPGMADIPLSSLDGHSTRGTLGVGLGAIDRLSTRLEISSEPGLGTVLVAGLWAGDDHPPPVDVGGLSRPIDGEQVCGDIVGARELAGSSLLMVADGLGHGTLAAQASVEALAAFHDTDSIDPIAVLRAIHTRLSGTRGAAVAVAVADPSFTQLAFAGVGNISGFVHDGERRQALLSHPGIIGHKAARMVRVDAALPEDAIVVLHSDGVRESWDLRAVAGLGRRSAIVIAATLLRDAGTRPDDASVLIARRRR
jgi:anti-sigma regulatory factor (Ser/Thr protein kinase)